MLTPIDVHLLVGFLSSVGKPEDVELELGSMVWHVPSEQARDVDVTLMKRSASGSIESFSGIEVRGQITRPMGTIQVEQLCVKMNRMPDLTSRAIVSASGYSDPARKVATYEGVELWRLDEWKQDADVVSAVPRDGTMGTRFPKWTNLRIGIDPVFKDAIPFPPLETCSITDLDGRQLPGLPKLRDVFRAVLEKLANELVYDEKTELDVNRSVPLPVPIVIEMGRLRGMATAVQVVARLEWQEDSPELEYKMLVRDSDNTSYVECAIAELQNGDLFGMGARGTSTRIKTGVISLSDRNRKKIYKYRWPDRTQ